MKRCEHGDLDNCEKCATFAALVEVARAAKAAVKKLNQVRTGADFECECWEVAHNLDSRLRALNPKLLEDGR